MPVIQSSSDAGDPVEQATVYDREGADELVFLDINASHEGRATMLDMVRRIASLSHFASGVASARLRIFGLRCWPGQIKYRSTVQQSRHRILSIKGPGVLEASALWWRLIRAGWMASGWFTSMVGGCRPIRKRLPGRKK